MLLPCLAVLLVVGSVGVRAEWPCPIDNQIYPCICQADEYYNLFMDCSNVTSTLQLDGIFNYVIFPFVKFLRLTINHDPNDNNNQLTQINAHTFGEVSFEEIYIHGTKLELIADEAFTASHFTLREYDISNNRMKDFPFEALPDYISLETLNLNDNMFPELPKIASVSLRNLYASNNPNMLLGELDSSLQFSHAKQLREITLSDIGLTDSLPSFLFDELPYLERLDLSNNNLVTLDVYDIKTQNSTLQYVDLSNNQISEVYHDSITGLQKGGYLLMRNNKLQRLMEYDWNAIFLQLNDTGIIDLQGNDLLCGCDTDWLFLDTSCGYLGMITDTTTCTTGQQLIFLDPNIVCTQCFTDVNDCVFCDIYGSMHKSAK